MVVGVVVRKPEEARHLLRLLRTRGKQTVSVRLPWLPFEVIDLLSTEVSPASRVFEFGGGGSTTWFADHAGRVVTVDHDPGWTRVIALATQGNDLVDVRFAVADGPESPYVRSIEDQPDDGVDVVLVDGRQRVACVSHAMDKVKPGGLLILDDSDRPKYAEAHRLLETWSSKAFFGFVPCKDEPGYTTVWRRPSFGWQRSDR